MELQNFDKILERVPKMSRPMRVILAGSDGENMLRGLFQITDSCGIRIFFYHCVYSLRRHDTLFRPQAHSPEHLWQGESGEDHLLFLRRIIRNIYHRKT